jgi:ribosomal protein S18 acetylase RimI-like enzyme
MSDIRKFIDLVESEEWPADQLQEIFSDRIDQISPNAKVSLNTQNPNRLEISHIGVERNFRGTGEASRAMELLTSLADEYGVTLVLGVAEDPDEDFDEDALFSWYERHNFENCGFRRMVREPFSNDE